MSTVVGVVEDASSAVVSAVLSVVLPEEVADAVSLDVADVVADVSVVSSVVAVGAAVVVSLGKVVSGLSDDFVATVGLGAGIGVGS